MGVDPPNPAVQPGCWLLTSVAEAGEGPASEALNDPRLVAFVLKGVQGCKDDHEIQRKVGVASRCCGERSLRTQWFPPPSVLAAMAFSAKDHTYFLIFQVFGHLSGSFQGRSKGGPGIEPSIICTWSKVKKAKNTFFWFWLGGQCCRYLQAF